MKTLIIILALAATTATARGLDDDNGRDCAPCEPGVPTSGGGVPVDADMDDGRKG